MQQPQTIKSVFDVSARTVFFALGGARRLGSTCGRLAARLARPIRPNLPEKLCVRLVPGITVGGEQLLFYDEAALLRLPCLRLDALRVDALRPRSFAQAATLRCLAAGGELFHF